MKTEDVRFGWFTLSLFESAIMFGLIPLNPLFATVLAVDSFIAGFYLMSILSPTEPPLSPSLTREAHDA